MYVKKKSYVHSLFVKSVLHCTFPSAYKFPAALQYLRIIPQPHTLPAPLSLTGISSVTQLNLLCLSRNHFFLPFISPFFHVLSYLFLSVHSFC